MSNADRFLTAFSSIERYLRELTKSGKYTTFYAMLADANRKNSVVRRYTPHLKDLADLRNVIVHQRTDGRIIADPNDGVVAEIEQIRTMLLNPPKVIPTFKADVLTLAPNARIAEAVKAMRERSFSQVPIYDNTEFAGLLTANTITRWLGASLQQDVFILSETKISDVLTHTEDREHVCFIGSRATLFDALDQFQAYERNDTRLEAMLITNSGRANESLLGIITVYDLPKINELKS
jgi:CBS domain-containing protein